MSVKETILKEELSETKLKLNKLESLVCEYFELDGCCFVFKTHPYKRKKELEKQIKELCLPKKLITTSTLLKKEN